MRVPCLALVLLAGAAQAEVCAGDVLFQNAVASSCTSISGDLIIANTRTSQLAGDLNLIDIGGSLVVAYNPALTSLTGLRVQRIGGEVSIASNYNLTDVDALAGVSITGGVSISANRILLNMQGVCNASAVGGLIDIELRGVTYASLSFCTASSIIEDTAALFTAVRAWRLDSAAAELQYGPIGEWDVSRVESFFDNNAGLFEYSNDLPNVDIPDLSNWDTSQVTNMQVMLTRFYHPDTSYALHGCPSHARHMHLDYHRRATCPTRPLRSTKRAGISRRRWTYASARARTTRCATSPSAWTPPPTRSYFTAARSSSLIT